MAEPVPGPCGDLPDIPSSWPPGQPHPAPTHPHHAKEPLQEGKLLPNVREKSILASHLASCHYN